MSNKRVPLGDLFLTFLLIGATSFGGGMTAYLHHNLVTKKGWMNEEEFLSALGIAQALPGLNSTNMSVIAGDRLRGPIGSLAAFAGMTLPGSIMILILGVFYISNRHDPNITSVLKGVAAASVGLLLAVTVQIGRKQLQRALDIAFVITTIALVSILKISLPYVLLILIPVAVFLYRPRLSAPGSPPQDKPNPPAQ